MSVEAVKEYLKAYGKENDVLEFEVSSATVALAAAALDTLPCRIAKTLSFKYEEGCILVVAAGDVKIDNAKFRHSFGLKAKMLTAEEAVLLTGHAVGGVCPFAVKDGVKGIYIDESIKQYDYIYPACGSSNSAIKLTPQELFTISGAESWVDVTKNAEV